MRIAISEITFDERTQPRAKIIKSLISEYAESMEAGDVFPPVVLFDDGEFLYCADGWHRARATEKIGSDEWDSCIPVLNEYLRPEMKSADEFETFLDAALRISLDAFCVEMNISRQYGFYEMKLLAADNGASSDAAD